MQSVREIASAIVVREGGFVNDPDDPGGATKYGVTIHTMRRLGLDLTGDGAVDVADVRRLGRAQAVDIFVRHYFNAPRIAELPAPLQPSVFDMYVNAGSNAVKILQSLLREMGQDITVDGAIGPSRKYARSRTGGKGGWIRRAEEFIAPRYHMSEADFARRVAQWG